MTTKTAHSPTSAGFTLIEMLVAIVMMGIIASIGIPGLYGIYQRQQMLNTANEIISLVKTARAMAQANDQGRYAQNPPVTTATCSSSKPYVDNYSVVIDGNGLGYKLMPGMWTGCGTPTATQAALLPSPLEVTAASGFPIYFKTTSGKMSFTSITDDSTHKASLEITANGYLGNAKYYVCITREKMYAQPTNCP